MPAGRRIGSGVISLIIANAIGMSAAAQTTGADPIANKAAVCSGCHGDNGVPASNEVPIIWGQHAGYIFLNLRDYQTGARKNELMEPVVATLSRTDMLALGEYFEKSHGPILGRPERPPTSSREPKQWLRRGSVRNAISADFWATAQTRDSPGRT
jgi:cytochrome c553